MNRLQSSPLLTQSNSTGRSTLKVLMIAPRLPRGGPIIDIYTQIRHLAALGISVELASLSPQPGESMLADFEALKIPVHCFNGTKRNYPYTIMQLQRFLARQQYDVIHSTQVRPDFFVGLLRSAHLLRKSVLVSTVKSRPEEEARFGMGELEAALFTKAWVRVWKRFDAVVPLCRGVYDDLSKHGMPSSRMQIINNGIDTDDYLPPRHEQRAKCRARLSLSDHDYVVGTVAGLIPRKAIHTILYALSQLSSDLHCKFLIVGSGSERSALESLAAKLGLSDRIHWAGEQKDVQSFLYAMDLFVLPSVSEGLPRAVCEAGACGLPVLASDIAGHRDVVVPGENGFLFPLGDARALAELISKLAVNQDMGREMGAQFRIRIEQHFSAERAALQYAQLFESLISKSVICN